MNNNFVHQVGDQPRLYYAARSTNHQDIPDNIVIAYLRTGVHKCLQNS